METITSSIFLEVKRHQKIEYQSPKLSLRYEYSKEEQEQGIDVFAPIGSGFVVISNQKANTSIAFTIINSEITGISRINHNRTINFICNG